MRRHDIGAVYHLAALLSAVAEQRPRSAWSVNMGGVYNLLEAAGEGSIFGLGGPIRCPAAMSPTAR